MKIRTVLIRLTIVIMVILALLALTAFAPAPQEVAPTGGLALASEPVVSFVLTPDLLAAIAAAALSLAFSYVPGLNTWFAALPPEYKRLVMLGLLILAALGVAALTCAGVIVSGIACSTLGFWKFVELLIVAIMASQSTYMLTPQTSAVRSAAYMAKTDEHTAQSYG